MTRQDMRFAAVAVLVLAGTIAAGANVAAAGRTSDSSGTATTSGPMRCEIRQSLEGDTILIQPVVRSDRAVSGAYSLSLSGGGSGGSSNIRQGGDFTAAAGSEIPLGQLSVGAGGIYNVTLKLTAGGASVSCAKKVTGAI
ncbi:MAG: hypothetical protein J0H11_10025 [Rhizobiales bacterium]|nr:hypothetical protein [Hyphomicrobiales bacterium]